MLMFFIGCSTTPVKYDKPVKVDDYKYFVRLKEEKDDPVSKKTFSQKFKESFTKNPKVKTSEVKEADINTDPVTTQPGKLMARAERSEPEAPRDIGKTILLYLIYLQALIIAIFAYVILRHQKKSKKMSADKRELNL